MRFVRFIYWFIVLLGLSSAGSLGAQEIRTRMVIATKVVCRAEPTRSAQVVHSYLLGDIIAAARESRENGEDWYFDRSRVSGSSPTCWVFGPLTAGFERSDPEPALLAAAGHVLQRSDQVSFGDYVEVDNLLAHDFASALASSGLLQFRRLSIIERAVSLPSATGRVAAKEPLKRAWLSSRPDLLKYFDPADRWFLQPETYWSLYDQHPDPPWAEELAWAAARLQVPGDECYSYCTLQAVNRTFQQYWTRRPNGAAINEAIERAISRARYALRLACEEDSYVPPAFLDQMRSSLAEVTIPGKPDLLRCLDDLEQAQGKCKKRP